MAADNVEDRVEDKLNVSLDHIIESKPQLRVKKYMNQGGNFITGIDIDSEESADKREKRFERFGNTPLRTTSDVEFSLEKLEERAKRFGVSAPVYNGEVVKYLKKLPVVPKGDTRNEAILLHGTNHMGTKEVFAYFSLYSPSHLEWIDDSSCIAVWEDTTSAHRAYYGKGLNPVISETNDDSDSPPVWRLGDQHLKADQLLLRYATTGDIKKPGSASRSLYYQTHGLYNSKRNRKVKKPKGERTLNVADARLKINKNKTEAMTSSEGDDMTDRLLEESDDSMEVDTVAAISEQPDTVNSITTEENTKCTNDLRTKIESSKMTKSGVKSRLG